MDLILDLDHAVDAGDQPVQPFLRGAVQHRAAKCDDAGIDFDRDIGKAVQTRQDRLDPVANCRIGPGVGGDGDGALGLAGQVLRPKGRRQGQKHCRQGRRADGGTCPHEGMTGSDFASASKRIRLATSAGIWSR